MSEGEGEYAMKHIFSYMLIIIYIALLPEYVIPRILYNVKQPRGCLFRGSPVFRLKNAGYLRRIRHYKRVNIGKARAGKGVAASGVFIKRHGNGLRV